MSKTVENELKDVVKEMATDVLSILNKEQRAALESKFMALDTDIRTATKAKYPAFNILQMYVARQLVKEANSRLASTMTAKWFGTLELYAEGLNSPDATSKGTSEKVLKELAEELDEKISAKLIKKYKQAKDMTSKSDMIIRLCGVFGISTTLVA